MCDSEGKVAARSSLCSSSSRAARIMPNTWKSDMYIVPPNELARLTGGRNLMFSDTKSSCGEYYKKYDHDEVPVRDYLCEGKGDNHHSFTNTELDKLEQNVLQKQDFDDTNSYVSLESNVQFFKHTVQQIFDNFYTTMHDFEHYKKKFHEILEKNRNDSVEEMEQFIKDMIHDIMSSDSIQNQISQSTSKDSQGSDDKRDGHIQTSDIKAADTGIGNTESDFDSSIMEESFKNQAFQSDNSDANVADAKSKSKQRVAKNGEIFNIYLLTANPCLEIKMNDRNLLSEINIRGCTSSNVSKIASAENVKKLAAKKREIEIYAQQSDETHYVDRDIPVRISSAKKNIYLDEDFICDPEKECTKSFMAKICNYLCRKIRKGL